MSQKVDPVKVWYSLVLYVGICLLFSPPACKEISAQAARCQLDKRVPIQH